MPTQRPPDVKPRLVIIKSRSPLARIFLRSPRKSDSYSFTCRAHDPECTRYLPWIANPKTPITVESNHGQIKTWRGDSMIGGLFLCIELLDKPDRDKVDPSQDPLATIGESGFGPLNLDKRTADLGVMIAGGEMRGKGYAVEALEMCFAYGFDNLGLETITLGTHKDNKPMKGLAETKFGLEPVWREHQQDWLFKADKKWWDARQIEKGDDMVVVYGVEEDWFEE